MKHVALLIFSLISILGLSSCDKDEPVNSEYVKTNQWIYNSMKHDYLFYKDIPDIKKLNLNQVPDSFFVRLLSSQEKGKRSYFFSYLEKKETTTKSANVETSYGFEFTRYNSPNGVRVIYVQPNSPASRAGIKRGDWYTAINGTAISANNYQQLISGGAITLTRAYFNASATSPATCLVTNGTINLGAATTVEDNPVFLDTVFTFNNTKVGYLVYNSFTSGPDGYTDKTYDNLLKTVFAKFKSNGINKLIIDLRFNGGGLLTSCQLLTSMILPSANLGKVMAIEEYNDIKTKEYSTLYGSNYDKTYFLPAASVANQNVNQTELCVICSEFTASASELLINALKPYMSVTLVGTTTIGKNMGSYEIEDANYNYILHPITIKIYNSLNQSDYANGFTSDVYFDEYQYGDKFLELGNIQEMVLNETLQKMGLVSSTRSISSPTLQLKMKSTSLERKNNQLILK